METFRIKKLMDFVPFITPIKVGAYLYPLTRNAKILIDNF